ncbi:virulence metalloprotease-like isoform X3 [Watersipora subatra]|uniref:virulence metalloprotease-like isoform X3 n=1 Tax=Watersipora subatra TaxID=2589382 RepID=UPI00355B5CF6
MEIKYIIFTGLILFFTQSSLVEAARRGTRRPGRNNAQQQQRTTAPDNANQQSNMNIGGLSDAIMNALRPTINDMASGVSRNRNNRGNANGRQQNTMPEEPAEVNLTLSEIIEQYPWIENPESVVETSSGSSRSGPDSGNGGNNPSPTNEMPGPNSRPNRNRNDGKTRFNNPQYLRDQLEGLNRDNYNFRVTQGVKTADGNYKVKLLQDWRNLPIYGTSLVLEQERDTNLILESADGEFLSGIEDDITSEVPALSKDQALQRAVAFNQDQGKPIKNPKAKLIVDTIGEKAVLAYLIDYFVPSTEEPNDPITVMPTARPTQPITDAPTTNFFTSTSRWQGRSRRRRCRNQRRRGRGSYRACMNRAAASSESSGVSLEDTTLSPIQEMTIDQIQQEIKREYTEDKQVNGARREFLAIDANTGDLIRKWTGLASAIGMSRVPLLVGLQNAPRQYEEFVRRNDVTDECFYQKAIGSYTYLTVQDQRVPSNSFRDAFSFLCTQAISTDYDQTNGAASPRNSAYKWASEALSFFRRAGNSRINFNVDVEVHHPGFGAYWSGDKVILGDGDTRFYYPMTGPDIVMHEIAHAFTEHNSGLHYVGQSGAIDEAYSDMAACAFLNYFFDDDTPDVYRIGKRVSKVGAAMRDMCNPRSSSLIFYDATKPIITSASDWTSSTRIHNASSLYNKAFCQLSKTRGWNIFLAFKVFTAANLVYWGPDETFNTGSCGVRKAAANLMGTEQAKNDVDRAFASVNIACPPGWTF